MKHNQICTGFSLVSSRRRFLESFGMGLGVAALAQLIGADIARGQSASSATDDSPGGALKQLHFRPRAKRVIFLFQSGGPSQLDLFDYKPELQRVHGQQLPASVRMGQRLTGMSGNQSSLPLVASPFRFAQHGENGVWMSELLPHTAKVADELCVMRSLHTEAINHGPAVTFVQTGSQLPGRPSIGAWLDYGLGSENQNLPSFVVMVTRNKGGQPLQARLWGSGFLPSRHQGVRFRPDRDPILYLNNPPGVSAQTRRAMLDALNQLHADGGTIDQVLENRIAQYELGFRMQSSIPEVTDFSQEPQHVLDEYGPDVTQPGTYAAHCLLARRLVERGVRFVQLYHPGWDQHGNLPGAIRAQCRETDQPTAALVLDLKRRGLLDDTLVVWGGEFGRTNYCQGKLTPGNFGRDHHPRCFTLWMAGAGVRPGVYGETDDLGYNIAADQIHVHDFQATLLYLLGIDHERLTYRHQGRRYRLTDVHGRVVQQVIA